MEKKKIIVVEDDEEVLDMLYSIFERDFEVFRAENGKEAYEMFFHIRPSVIVTDIVMPVMDGTDLTRKVKTISPDTTVFAISGLKDIQLNQATEAGADEVFEKPGGITSLYKAVNKLDI
ncbi:MAG: response regulator [Oligoflexales bacterium]